jgi:tetratricopeptide (TPR) repeat protein
MCDNRGQKETHFLFCPSCSQSFGRTFSRCPECHCWLKPSAPAMARTTNLGAESAQAGRVDIAKADTEEMRSGPRSDSHASIHDDGRYQGWGATPSKTPATHEGWTHPAVLAQDPDDHWTTPTAKLSSTEDWIEDEIDPDFHDRNWVDEDLNLYDDDETTQYVPDYQPPQPPASGSWQWVLMAVASFVLLSVYAVKIMDSPAPAGREQVQNVEAESLDSAKIWIQSAQDSLKAKDYEMASAQLQKGIGFLQDGDAPKSEIVAAKMQLSESLSSQGDPEGALKVLSSLEGQGAAKAVAQLKKDLRVDATATQELAKEALRAGKGRQALQYATKSSQIFDRYGGQAFQRAKSYELMAQAHLANNNAIAARQFYKQANALEPTNARTRAISELKPQRPIVVVNNPTDRKPPPKPKLSLGGNNVPKGERPAKNPTPSGETEQVVQNNNNPKPPPQPEFRPVAPPQETTTERIGREGVVDSYANPAKPRSVY